MFNIHCLTNQCFYFVTILFAVFSFIFINNRKRSVKKKIGRQSKTIFVTVKACEEYNQEVAASIIIHIKEIISKQKYKKKQRVMATELKALCDANIFYKRCF